MLSLSAGVRVDNMHKSAFKADSSAHAPIEVKKYMVMEHMLTGPEYPYTYMSFLILFIVENTNVMTSQQLIYGEMYCHLTVDKTNLAIKYKENTLSPE